MKPRLVLWDFDGTLADTLESGAAIYNRIAGRHKALPIKNTEVLRHLSSRQLLKELRIRWYRLPFLVREFLREQSQSIDEVELYPGIAETLESLSQADVRQAVVSSNSEANIRACLENRGVLAHFEFIVGMRRVSRKQRALRRALRRADVLPSEDLYVGDETRDILAARHVGLPVAAVAWGVHGKQVLLAESPDCLIEDARQLAEEILCD